MDDVRLKEWLGIPRSNEEYQKLFLNMDVCMRYIHARDYGVVHLDVDHISLVEGDIKKVLFDEIDRIDPSYKEEAVHQNIREEALLAMQVYCNYPLNYQFLKDNFSEFEVFLPVDDVGYYKGVIQRDANIYYSEFVEARAKSTIKAEQEALGEGQGKGISLSKATEAGRLYAQTDEDTTSSVAAFVSVYFFPAIIIFLSFMIPFLAWIIALTQ